MGMKYSPTIDSPLSGSRKWISATRPCCEFSIGMIALPALPIRTASSASSKLKHGNGRHWGQASIAARCELAPGEPWKAIARCGAAAADSGMVSTIAKADRKSVVSGKSVAVRVDFGGRRIIKKKRKQKKH